MPLTYQPRHATYTNNCHAMPIYGQLPCHPIHGQLPCHVILTANHHAISYTVNCHTNTSLTTMPYHVPAMPCHIYIFPAITSPHKPASSLTQLDTIALSLAQDCDRGHSKASGCPSPSKRFRAQSPSPSRSCSHSHSPPHHCQHCHTSAEHSTKDQNTHGRRSRQNTNGRGRAKNSHPSFFQGGTAVCGSSTCAICLGRHEHEYAKCSAPKLWNGGKTFV